MPISDTPNYLSEDIERRINSISWFERCGKETHLNNIQLSHNQVQSWTEARRCYKEDARTDFRAAARNHLTLYLHNYHRQEYRKWNHITREAKARLINHVTQISTEFADANDEPIEFVHCVQWDVLAAVMELVYEECNPPHFYIELLKVYEQGHFPCGWEGVWPDGTLLFI